MKSNFGTGTNTISFFLDDINLFAPDCPILDTSDKEQFRHAHSKSEQKILNNDKVKFILIINGI